MVYIRKIDIFQKVGSFTYREALDITKGTRLNRVQN